MEIIEAHSGLADVFVLFGGFRIAIAYSCGCFAIPAHAKSSPE